ncbi:hypothetical protein [Arthrobacter sp. USHLN218]|uniref:hypothetical protein n=1 Tax=Arthrobacter sp. USHLN218 TaxID=3081232 RepID=UPI0030195141
MDPFVWPRPSAACWRSIARACGLFPAADAAAILQVTPQALHRLALADRILEVRVKGEKRYPGFQFDDGGRVIAGLSALLCEARRRGIQPEELVFWLVRPAGAKGHKRPLARLLTGKSPLNQLPEARITAPVSVSRDGPASPRVPVRLLEPVLSDLSRLEMQGETLTKA